MKLVFILLNSFKPGLCNQQEKDDEDLEVVELEIEPLSLDNEDYVPLRVVELEIEPVDFEIEDLKSLSLNEICSTFDCHQEYLTDIYSRLIKETVKHQFNVIFTLINLY